MSEPTKRPEDGIVVGGKKSHLRGSVKLPSKLMRPLLFLLLLVLVAGGVYAGWHYLHKPKVEHAVTKPKTPSQTAQQIVASYLAQKQDDPKSALNIAKSELQTYEQRAGTVAGKQTYASAMVQVYNSAGDKQAALVKAQQTNELYKSAFSAAQLAAQYQLVGNKTQAIVYYKLASSRSPKTAPTERSPYNEYRIAAENLESAQ